MRKFILITVAILITVQSAYASENLRDPTRPLAIQAARVKAQELKLQAIISSGNHKSAIINGRSRREGETINGNKVIKIAENRVYIEKNGKTRVLSLRPNVLNDINVR